MNEAPGTPIPAGDPLVADAADAVRPLNELRSTGLLWLINTTVFHPRGYALGLALDENGDAYGWHLFGDGTEPWRFADPEPGTEPEGYLPIDSLFKRVKELLK